MTISSVSAFLRRAAGALALLAVFAAAFSSPAVSCGDPWEDIVLGGRKPAAMERDFLQFVLQRMDETCFMIRSRDHEAAIASTVGIHKAFSALAEKYGTKAPDWASKGLNWTAGFREIVDRFSSMADLSKKGDIIGSHVAFLSGKDRLISLFLNRDMLTPAWCLEDYRRTLKMLEGEIIKSAGGEFLAKAVSSCSKAVLLKERLNPTDLAIAGKDLDDLIARGRNFIDWLCKRDEAVVPSGIADGSSGESNQALGFDPEVRDRFSAFVKSFHAAYQKFADLQGVKATAASIEGLPMKECCPATEAIGKKEAPAGK